MLNTRMVVLILLVCGGISLAQAQTKTPIPRQLLQRLNPELIQQVGPAIEAESIGAASATRSAPGSRALRRFGDLQFEIAQPGALQPAAAEPEVPELSIGVGEYLLIKSADPVRSIACSQAGVGECVESEFRYVTTTMEAELVNLSLAWESTRQLRLSDSSDFIGDIFVQLHDLDSPDLERMLSGTIQVVVSAPVDSIEPGALLEFDRTNRFQPVRLVVRTPDEPTVVRLTPANSGESNELSFDVNRPTLELSIGQDSILGFGLETATVTVRANGVDMVPNSAVTVTSMMGRLQRNDLLFNESGTSSTFVRSRGTGTDTITAEMGQFAVGTDTIVYETPWAWLIAVLLGAVIGITLRLAMRAKAPDGRDQVTFNIVIGFIGGLLTAVLYGLGVNILPLPLPGGFSEGLTVVLSALGAWIFPKWLSALAPTHAADASAR